MGAIRRQGLHLAPLLERHVDRSPFSLPLFNAIIHHYPDMLQSLAANGLELTQEISVQHLLLAAEALQADGRLAGREFVRAPRPGETESISLLMCAASTGNLDAVKMLLSTRGVLPAVPPCVLHGAENQMQSTRALLSITIHDAPASVSQHAGRM